MKTTKARLGFIIRARQDLRRARHFLRRHSDRPRARVREIINAIRLIQEFPTLRPVEGLSRQGVELRCRRAGRFVVIYSYSEPSPSDPNGLVSIRAVQHASEEDVRFGVEERRESKSDGERSFLVLE